MPKPTPPEDLKIDLAAPPAWTFAPGDTIIGTVVRQSHLVTPRASLELRLQAITQTKIEQYHGTHGPTPYGGGFDGPFDKSRFGAYWNLLPSWNAEVLFRGPVHIAKQGEAAGAGEKGGSSNDSWAVPFEVSIPLMPEESSIKRHAKSVSYLPLDDASIATQVLPGSFACKTPNDGSRNITAGSITYQLEATLHYTHGGAASVSRASASFVLRHTRHPCAEPPLPDYANVIHRLSPPVTVLSQRLAPGMHDAQLSFRQKTQKFFGSSRVPQLTYRFDFGMPRSVSLDFGDGGGGGGGDGILPFTMAVVPDPDRTNAALHGVQQTFLIHSITLSVDAITDVRATAGFSDSFVRTGRHVQRHPVVLLTAQKSKPIVLTTGEGDSESSEKSKKSKKSDSNSNSNTIDIGTMFNLHLRPDGLHKGDTSSKGTEPPRLRSSSPLAVYPDFVSYLMKHTHVLSCEVGVSVAGESGVVNSSAPLRVLGED